MDRTIPRDEWVEGLRQFTHRNAGRRTLMEVDGPEIGAQAAGTDYPLRGIAFDPRDGRVEIMLGDMATVERRITHTIQGAAAIDLLRSDDGHDRALRIAHDGAQTVLRFVND
jgi:hypothetical protein